MTQVCPLRPGGLDLALNSQDDTGIRWAQQNQGLPVVVFVYECACVRARACECVFIYLFLCESLKVLPNFLG